MKEFAFFPVREGAFMSKCITVFQVMFHMAVYTTGIEIYETYHAGGVKAILGKADEGQWQTLWTTQQVQVLRKARILSPPLKVNLQTKKYRRCQGRPSITKYSISMTQSGRVNNHV